MLAWVAAGVLTLVGRARLRRAGVGLPADRRRLRLPPRNLLAGARLSLGLGDVLEHAHRHHRGDRDGVRALCGLLRAAGRHRHARGGRRRHLVLSAVNYVGVRARQPRADRLHGRQGRGGGGDHRRSAGCSADRSRRRRRGAAASDQPASNFLLAVGAGLFAFGGWHMVTYTAEETVEPDAHHSARAR